VPSTMRLLGDRNWWLPERLRRLISTRLHLPETASLGALLLLALACLLVGCGPSGRILANEPPPRPSPRASTPTPSRLPDPQPIVLPRDEAAHDRLTEWWYYTGHLRAADERRFGFEFVIFRAERGTFPVTWASHLALTDELGGRFLYEQRSEIGPQVDAGRGDGFDLAIMGGDSLSALLAPAPSATPTPAGDATPWRMTGRQGEDRLSASAAEFGLDLLLEAAHDEPVLHDGDGWVDFGPAGGSYYYSWPRMAVSGDLRVDGAELAVEGTAWFDHQWGDFIAVGGGGWDWFAVNLEDGTDLTLSLVRDADGNYPLVYGTLVEPDGSVRHLTGEEFTVRATAEWTSARTGATYPARWDISLPGEQLEMELTPTVADQELDTRATTGVVYWEGSQVVRATRAGEPLAGEAYVELTGYPPQN